MARAHGPGGRGVQPRRLSQLTVCLWGMSAPNGADSQARGMGSTAKAVVAAHGAPVGGGSPYWRGLTGWGDGESSPVGGRTSRCACGGWQPVMAARDGAGPQAGGTGSLAELLVGAHGAPVGDGNP